MQRRHVNTVQLQLGVIPALQFAFLSKALQLLDDNDVKVNGSIDDYHVSDNNYSYASFMFLSFLFEKQGAHRISFVSINYDTKYFIFY